MSSVTVEPLQEPDSHDRHYSSGDKRLPKELRRQHLVLSALRIFSSQGYHTTTMNQVASAADVTKPVLYQHFKSKRELYLAVLDEQIKELTERLVRPLYDTQDNRERTERVIGAFFEFTRTNLQGYRLIFESDIHSDLAVQQRIDDLHLHIANHIAQVLEPNSGLAAQEAVLISRTLTGMALSAVQHALQQGAQDQELARAQNLVFRLAWGGLLCIDDDSVYDG